MSRVLVIDDDAGVRESFRAVLDVGGYEVALAEDGAAGIESARIGRPGLIFLDLKMPGLSGVETLAGLHATCPGVPVYIVTAFYGDYISALRNLQSEGVDFNLARKPLSAGEILMIAASRLGGGAVHRVVMPAYDKSPRVVS
jgi:DNA-binding NtrC family response regulator